MPAPNDRDSIQRQYQNDDALATRQAIHDEYTVPRINYYEWVLSLVRWRGDERLLDVGSASGVYYKPLIAAQSGVDYVALDISDGMLNKHVAPRKVQADGEHLPFADGEFDVVMANHMLYHVPDIDSAIKEFRRILKPDGLLLTATNSVQTMPELQVLMRRAILLLARTGSTQIQPPSPASNRFALENGTRQLARHFRAVMRHDLPSKLIFPKTAPVLAYLESTRTLREPQLPDGVNWDDVMLIMQQQVDHLINHLGELVVNKLAGALIATDEGDFIRDFIQTHAQAGKSE